MEVGIRELKARLSHYVRAARAGERVVLTERGRPVAYLIAASPQASPFIASIPSSLADLVERGRITPPSVASPWSPLRGARASRSVSDILEEDRGGE